MHRVLFVCHGNICRSTMAEFVMKDLVAKAGREEEFIIDSKACRQDELGSDTHPGTKAVLRNHGIKYTPRQARQITLQDYDKWDYIIGMDKENYRDLTRLFREKSPDKISLLLAWAGAKREVADPWYTGDFETTYQDVQRGCQALIAKLTLNE